MPERVSLYDSTYSHFADQVLNDIRRETFGVDIGQNSWLTVDETDRLLPRLNLVAGDHLLEVASGSGGPALYLARTFECHITGIDVNQSGVNSAIQMAAHSPEAGQVRFCVADASVDLPFAENSFDALLCIDSMNHLPDRLAVLQEWRRVLRPSRRALFTDPVVITGPVTNDELALRSAIGLFLFVPPGVNEQLITQAGLRLIHREDVTGNAAVVAGRWHQARQGHREELLRIEGEPRFEGLQRFFEAVHNLSSQRRLSRIAYLVEKSR